MITDRSEWPKNYIELLQQQPRPNFLFKENIMFEKLQDETTKDLLLSRTFLSAAVGIGIMALKMLGVQIVDDNESVTNLVEVISVAAAIYFHTISKKSVSSIAGIKLAK